MGQHVHGSVARWRSFPRLAALPLMAALLAGVPFLSAHAGEVAPPPTVVRPSTTTFSPEAIEATALPASQLGPLAAAGGAAPVAAIPVAVPVAGAEVPSSGVSVAAPSVLPAPAPAAVPQTAIPQGGVPQGGAPQVSPSVPGRPVRDAVLRPLALEVGAGQVVTLPAAAANVFEADPKVAEVRPASANTLFIFGVGPGRTTVAAMDAAGAILAQFSVSVTRSDYAAREAQGAISRLMPSAQVTVRSQQRGLLLSGRVETAAEAARAASVARGYLGEGQTVENQIIAGGKTQVALRVRIAEMSRQVSRALGINWTAAGTLGRWGVMGATPGANLASAAAATNYALSPFGINSMGTAVVGFNDLNATIDALSQDSLVHLLAEPNLTTMSGEPASFLVGGEFPVPVAQGTNGQISVEFKRYGITLAFVPTVLSDGRINLHVSPEVSELTTTGAVTMSVSATSSITIPALLVRRAETTVELGSGQSFAIAGLLQDSGEQNANGLPGLGDLPVLGALFRSSAFQRKETELVIIVTPYVVKPVDNLRALRSPTDGLDPASEPKRVLLLHQFKDRVPAAPSTLSAAGGPARPATAAGQAGFLVQ